MQARKLTFGVQITAIKLLAEANNYLKMFHWILKERSINLVAALAGKTINDN